MDDTKSRKQQIAELRKRIRKRTELFLPELGSSIVVGTSWQKFQEGPAIIRFIESLSNTEQTTLMFCAPSGTTFPSHRHDQGETILMVSKCKDDHNKVAATIRTESGEHPLKYGDSIIIPAGELHSGVWHSDATVLLVFKPALPQKKSGEVVWNVKEDGQQDYNKLNTA